MCISLLKIYLLTLSPPSKSAAGLSPNAPTLCSNSGQTVSNRKCTTCPKGQKYTTKQAKKKQCPQCVF